MRRYVAARPQSACCFHHHRCRLIEKMQYVVYGDNINTGTVNAQLVYIAVTYPAMSDIGGF